MKRQIRLISLLLIALTCLNSSSLLATDDRLPGTEPLTVEGDIPSQMVEGIHKYLDWKTVGKSTGTRKEMGIARFLRRSETSIERIRRFRKIIGAVDPRVQSKGLEILGPAVASASADSGKRISGVQGALAGFRGSDRRRFAAATRE